MTDTRGAGRDTGAGEGRSFIGIPFRFVIVLPPAIADEAKNSKGGEGQVEDPFIQGLGGPLTQLLGRTGANGALRPARCDAGHHDNKQEYED